MIALRTVYCNTFLKPRCRFWAFSSAAVLAIILFYWLCGGVIGKQKIVGAKNYSFEKFPPP